MTEAQPPTVVEGVTTGDVEDEVPAQAKSAEERKAAQALSTLDAGDDSGATKEVDTEAVRKAMDRLTVGGGEVKKADNGEKKEVKKIVKVDAADVAFIIDQLELSKPKATELLKAHDANVVAALRAYVTSSA